MFENVITFFLRQQPARKTLRKSVVLCFAAQHRHCQERQHPRIHHDDLLTALMMRNAGSNHTWPRTVDVGWRATPQARREVRSSRAPNATARKQRRVHVDRKLRMQECDP